MNFKWDLTGDDPNDLKCVIGEDMLRVERLDEGCWWLAVYVKEIVDVDLMSGVSFPHQSTKDDAKMLAESIYILVKRES
jgi:hypothetical protein